VRRWGLPQQRAVQWRTSSDHDWDATDGDGDADAYRYADCDVTAAGMRADGTNDRGSGGL
jgi:hypothetical protein